MHLVELFLPLRDNHDKPFPAGHYIRVREELTKGFGGLTAFTRAPAEGLWKDSRNAVTRDDIVIFEVMMKDFDEAWWRDYKQALLKLFAQEEMIIRVQDIRLL